MSVGTYALISLEAYFSYTGIQNDDVLLDVLEIYCSDGVATAATIKKEGDTLTLKITGGPNADTDALDLAAAANDTISKLIAVINALGGWTARVVSADSNTLGSTNLKDFAETGFLGIANIADLEAYDYREYEQLIDQATNIIENSLGRQILSRDYPLERYDGGHKEIFLRQYPVTEVQLVSEGKNDVIDVEYTDTAKFNAYVQVTSLAVILMVDGTQINSFEIINASCDTLTEMVAAINGETSWEATLLDSSFGAYPSNMLIPQMNLRCLNQRIALSFPGEPLVGYELDAESGILYMSGRFWGRYREIFVSTTAGYATTPDAVTRGTLRFCEYMESREGNDPAMESERLGDYNYSRFGQNDLKTSLGAQAFSELMAYKRPLI